MNASLACELKSLSLQYTKPFVTVKLTQCVYKSKHASVSRVILEKQSGKRTLVYCIVLDHQKIQIGKHN